MNNKDILDIISKYLRGEASEDDVTRLTEWCLLSEDNRSEFLRIKKTWVLSDKNIDNTIESHKQPIWNNIVNHLSSLTVKKYTKRMLVLSSAVSAVVAILLLISFNYLGKQGIWEAPQFTTMYMPKGERGQLFLPDGTKVWLNSDTKITLSNTFNTSDRTVYLEGEAFFDVTKDEDHKFIVRSDNLDVVVYGTTFKVTAGSRLPDIKIALQQGKVSVFDNETCKMLTELQPNEEVVINKKIHSSQKKTFDPENYISWTFDELVFEYSPVNEVFSKMENWYGVDIKVTSPKNDLKYRFRIKTETLSEILELMKKMTPLEYKINGKEVIVTYK